MFYGGGAEGPLETGACGQPTCQLREIALDLRTCRNDAAIRFALCLSGVRSREISSTHTIHMESTHSTTTRGFKEDLVFTTDESQPGSRSGRQQRSHKRFPVFTELVELEDSKARMGRGGPRTTRVEFDAGGLLAKTPRSSAAEPQPKGPYLRNATLEKTCTRTREGKELIAHETRRLEGKGLPVLLFPLASWRLCERPLPPASRFLKRWDRGFMRASFPLSAVPRRALAKTQSRKVLGFQGRTSGYGPPGRPVLSG